MEQMVAEIKKLIPTKAETEVGDIVMILAKELQMPLYAKVIGIEPDLSRKDEWWHVHFAVLSMPIQNVSWTLRRPQISGEEIFTMGGEPRFIQAVDFSGSKVPEVVPSEVPSTKRPGLKRVK